MIEDEIEAVNNDEVPLSIEPTDTGPVKPTLPSDASFKFRFNDAFEVIKEKEKWKQEYEKKETELRQKIKDLEAACKKQQKEMNKVDDDMKILRQEYNRAIDKVASLEDENVLLHEKVKTYQNLDDANRKMQDKYDNHIKTCRNKATDSPSDNDNIEVLIQNKDSGYRRTSPSASLLKIPTKEVIHNYNLCKFQSKDEG